MNVNFDSNETMKMLAKTSVVQADGKEGKRLIDLVESVEGLKDLNKGDIIYLCSLAFSLGKMASK